MSSALVLSRNVFRYPPFIFAWLGRLLTSIASLAQGVTIGWQVYTIARLNHGIEQSAFLVGMVGLVQFLPLSMLSFLAGDAADRYDRRKIMLGCSFLHIFSSAGLAIEALSAHPSLHIVFTLAAMFGVTRAFMSPALNALTPMLVPRTILPRAIAWNVLGYQFGMIIGPWLSGILCSFSIVAAYAFSSALWCIGGISFQMIKAKTKPKHNNQPRLIMIREGLKYVWTNKIVLGAISLDLFAVLLGGVTALLPVFARDILEIGAEGFGILRSGPAIGSALMALLMSIRPLKRHAGPWMLGSVAVYGFATLVFAASNVLWLSVLALAVLGAADGISVFVRQSLVQIVTPDHMRGRVAAVSGLFISASNELGEFESGVMARLLGPIGSVVFGGLGSIAVTALFAKFFPALRKADKLIEMGVAQ
jgi:MFS family permease